MMTDPYSDVAVTSQMPEFLSQLFWIAVYGAAAFFVMIVVAFVQEAVRSCIRFRQKQRILRELRERRDKSKAASPRPAFRTTLGD